MPLSGVLLAREKPQPPLSERKPTVFGSRLLNARLARGWSQQDLENKSGVSRASISQIETGFRGKRPFRAQVIKLARAFGEPIDDWLRAAGYDSNEPGYVPPGRPSFREYVESDPFLTAEAKSSLVSLYVALTGRSEKPKVAKRQPRRRPGTG